ncbi:DUF4192 family protein [Streptomyces sp. M92]|uniref:DUF4192 family protein n=1 Tax=Streptomyces sp. M92 TaxID=2944250 RepID=UPI003FA71818
MLPRSGPPPPQPVPGSITRLDGTYRTSCGLGGYLTPGTQLLAVCASDACRVTPTTELVQRRSTGDELEAREALAMALGADPDYLFARLLHQACNEGLDPESVRRCLRAERGGREAPKGGVPDGGKQAAGAAEREPADPSPAVRPPLGRRSRTRSGVTADGVPRRPRAARGREPGAKLVRPRTPASGERPGPARTSRARSRAAEGEGVGRTGACAGGARTGDHGPKGAASDSE